LVPASRATCAAEGAQIHVVDADPPRPSSPLPKPATPPTRCVGRRRLRGAPPFSRRRYQREMDAIHRHRPGAAAEQRVPRGHLLTKDFSLPRRVPDTTEQATLIPGRLAAVSPRRRTARPPSLATAPLASTCSKSPDGHIPNQGYDAYRAGHADRRRMAVSERGSAHAGPCTSKIVGQHRPRLGAFTRRTTTLYLARPAVSEPQALGRLAHSVGRICGPLRDSAMGVAGPSACRNPGPGGRRG